MAFSLYDATIPVFTQLLGAAKHLVGKAEEHCADGPASETDLVNARLIDDMEPLSFQIKAVSMHSKGAMDGVSEGSFSPYMGDYPESFAAMHERIDEAVAALDEWDRAAVDALVGQPMQFKLGELVLPFTAESYLMSFAMPNFQFHLATAYDILRAQGVGIGKRDYLGQLQIKAG